MKIRIAPTQIQKTVLAPTMQQSIEVLLLPIAELSAAIDEQMQENPLLEVDEAKASSQNDGLEDMIKRNIERLSKSGTTIDHENPGIYPKEDYGESPLTRHISLEEHLWRSLSLETSDAQELKIGEMLIGNLNEDGYLTVSCGEVAREMGLDDPQPVEMLLRIIQNFEPVGIASRNLQECLITQVLHYHPENTELASKVINHHLEDLGRKRHEEIARRLKVPVEDIKSVARQIAALEPKPARKFRPHETNIYVKPDVTVTQDEDGRYHVLINNESIPPLRISQVYQNMLKQPNRTEEEKEFIREKIKNAIYFIKSIEQRQQTIRRIAEYIVAEQKDFFEEGHMGLKPMTLRDVAAAVDRNESTVCRAINQKHMDTPRGMLPMKFFFSQGLSASGAGAVSNRSIKEELKNIIDEEDKTKPLSDHEIETLFKSRGMAVARRTINKYRKKLKILPSHLRKI